MSENLTSINSLAQDQNVDNNSQQKITELSGNDPISNGPPTKPSLISRAAGFFKSKTFLIIALVILLLGIGVFVYFTFFSKNSVVVKDPTNISDASGEESSDYKKRSVGGDIGVTDFTSPINGKYVTEETYNDLTSRKPIAVMMNNSEVARPQAGIAEADIIYEAVAEGGITRLMGVFHSTIPDRVGAVRSARIYYLQLAAEYWPIFHHWGIAHRPAYELGLSAAEFEDLLSKGAAETDPRADARSYIDEIALPVANTDTTPNMFYREPGNYPEWERGFSKFETIYDEFKKYYPEPSWSEYQEFEGWSFKDEIETPTNSVVKISYDFWEDKTGFDTVWEYDEETNTYKRTQAGVVTIDKNTEEPVQVKNIVIQKVPETRLNDTKAHLLYDVIGKGDAVIYTDGGKTVANWSKSSARGRTEFTDVLGNPIEFNRGLTWVVILPDYSTVTEE
jgi:hypothetical protein